MEPIYRINKSRKEWKKKAVMRALDLREASREIRRLRQIVQDFRQAEKAGEALKKTASP